MLHETARRASEYEIDVLVALQRCRKRHLQFTTQWAAATPTACPKLALRGDVMGWLRGMGPAPLLGADVPAWAWRNLLQAQHFVVQHPAGSQPNTELVDYILGRLLPHGVMLAMLGATLLFFVMHNCVLKRASTVYKVRPRGVPGGAARVPAWVLTSAVKDPQLRSQACNAADGQLAADCSCTDCHLQTDLADHLPAGVKCFTGGKPPTGSLNKHQGQQLKCSVRDVFTKRVLLLLSLPTCRPPRCRLCPWSSSW